LEAYDSFSKRVLQIVDMPNRTVDLLHRFLNQGKGTLSKRGRTNEFQSLTDEEVRAVEKAYTSAFAGVIDRPVEEEVAPGEGT
jgi:hypothetical protein